MAPHGKVLVNASIRHRLCKNDFSHLSKASRKQSKKKVRQSFESTNNSELLHAADGGRTRTLSPERDFKSLVSASLQQSCFLFVASFYFSLRERFFLREREGFAFFDKIILPPFSLHVNHVKLFHLVVLDLRSIRDPGLPPGRSPCPDALLRVGDDRVV